MALDVVAGTSGAGSMWSRRPSPSVSAWHGFVAARVSAPSLSVSPSVSGFSGSVQNVEQAEGVYYSINTAMIGSRSGKKLIRAMNPDFILTETDGPYVVVDDRPAHPGDVKRVINWLAQEWGVSMEAATEKIVANWLR